MLRRTFQFLKKDNYNDKGWFKQEPTFLFTICCKTNLTYDDVLHRDADHHDGIQDQDRGGNHDADATLEVEVCDQNEVRPTSMRCCSSNTQNR